MGEVSLSVCMTVRRVAMWLCRRRLCLVQTTERLRVTQQVLRNSLVCACHLEWPAGNTQLLKVEAVHPHASLVCGAYCRGSNDGTSAASQQPPQAAL